MSKYDHLGVWPFSKYPWNMDLYPECVLNEAMFFVRWDC